MFKSEAFISKTQNDILFFGEIFKKFAIQESDYNQLRECLKNTYILTKELFEECDTYPLASLTKLRSKNMLNELSENDIIFQQYKKFTKDLNKDFIQPLTECSLNTLYENESSKILSVVLNTENNLDPEIAKSYAIFESVLGDVLKDFILPKDNLISMTKYASSQSPEYFNVFDRNLKHIKDELNDSLEHLTSCLAVKMFKAGIQFAKGYDKDDYDFESYKGLSKLLDRKPDELDSVLDSKTIEAEKLKSKDQDEGEKLSEDDLLDVTDILDKNDETK